MNYFAFGIITAFILASGLELIKSNWWMAVFYGCSALINIAVILK